MKTYRVTTVQSDGRGGFKKTIENMPMDANMEKLFNEFSAMSKEHGCKCKKPKRDGVEIVPRGHSVDVFCTDCGGFRQIG